MAVAEPLFNSEAASAKEAHAKGRPEHLYEDSTFAYSFALLR